MTLFVQDFDTTLSCIEYEIKMIFKWEGIRNYFTRRSKSFYTFFSFLLEVYQFYQGFPYGSVGKESTCNAGDPSSIPGSGRSPGEGIGYPLQYTWASLVAQLVKNPPAVRETWVQSLGWEDLLEKGMATHSSTHAWKIPYQLPLAGYSPWCRKESDTTEQLH